LSIPDEKAQPNLPSIQQKNPPFLHKAKGGNTVSRFLDGGIHLRKQETGAFYSNTRKIIWDWQIFPGKKLKVP